MRRRWPLAALAVLVVVAIAMVLGRMGETAAPAATATTTASSAAITSGGGRLVAHGVVAPVNQARVGTLAGGVLMAISVEIGDNVEAQREVARVRGPQEVEVLTAPFSGTVTGLLAHTGDTLVPGAGVLLVADLARLQVETTDVDEFLIGHVRAGQNVAVQVEALDRREVSGRVRTVALQPQTTAAGDQHYPVTIDLGGAVPDLRPGMTVRVTFPD